MESYCKRKYGLVYYVISYLGVICSHHFLLSYRSLLKRTLLINFGKQISHLPLCLVSLLQFVKQLSLLHLQLLRKLRRMLDIVMLLLDSLFVTVLQIMDVHCSQSAKRRFCADMPIPYFMVLLLPFLQKLYIVVVGQLIDF